MARSATPQATTRPEPGIDSSKAPDRMLDKPPVAPGTRTDGTLADGHAQPGKAAPQDEDHLQLPHERDQSVGGDGTGSMGTGAAGQQQREVLKQAHQDLKDGQVDTDLRATPGLDAERRQGMVDDPNSAPSPRGSVAESGKH